MDTPNTPTSNDNIDSLLASLDKGVAPANEQGTMPFDVPPPERRPSARAQHQANVLPFATKTEVKDTMREAEKASQARTSPMLSRKFGEMAKRVPGAERMRVYKRMPSGNVGYINEWNMRDLGVDDVEAFLSRYVKPTHGGGEYQITLIDGAGRSFDAGFVHIIEPAPEARDSGTAGLVRDVMDRLERNQNMLLQHQAAPIQQDPVDQMRRMRELEKEFGGGQNGSMMAMMMMQMQRPVGPDPMLMQMFQEMRAELRELKQQASLPPPMAPAATAPSWGPAEIAALIGTLVPVIKEVFGQKNEQLSASDIKLMMREMAEQFSSGPPADPLETAVKTISLFRELNGNAKEQTLKEKLEEMNSLKELAQTVVGGNGGGSGSRGESNFWDMAAAMVSNRGFGEGFGRFLGTAMDRLAPGAPGGEQRPAGPRVENLGAGPRPSGALPQGAPPAAPPPAQAAQPQLEIPDDFTDFLEKIETSPDNKKRIEATINALYRLDSMHQWRPFVRSLLGAAARDEKDAALRGLHNWLTALTKNKLLKVATGDLVMKTFVSEWQSIHEAIKNQMAAMLGQMQPPTIPAPAEQPEVKTDEGSGDEAKEEPSGEREAPQDIDLGNDDHMELIDT